MRKITSPKLANLEKEKCLKLKIADGGVGDTRRLVLSLASADSSGSNCSLSLGKLFSGEQVGLESVAWRHSGLLEKGTKDWPERTRRNAAEVVALEISQSERPNCDVAASVFWI